MDALTKLITFLKNWWSAIKEHNYTVSVDNFPDYPEFPEIPEVKIPDYPTEIKVSNLEEIKPIDKFADIVKAIEKQNKELKPQDKNVVGELKAILKELKKEKKDLTPELIDKVSELIKSVDKKSIDFSILENQLTELYGLLYSVKEYDEIKVKLNGKQFEKLSTKTAQAIAAGGATGQYDKLISDDLNNLVGLEIPPHDYIAITYVTVGNGIGEINTVTFKDGGSGGTTVATLTLGYDSSNNLTSVTRT
jgi:molybdopterin converting factor small subunit